MKKRDHDPFTERILMDDIDQGLFYYKSELSHERKVELTKWFRMLSREDQQKVMDIRTEGYDEGARDEADRHLR